MTTVSVFAPAKINLALHITGQRDDGYHELDSLVAFADVGDNVFLQDAGELAFSVTGPEADGVPDGPENLCVAAALAFGYPAKIQLDKRLPIASGLGGGSSDAAAVLKGLGQLSGRPFQGDTAMLGADLPICLHGGPARMRGIGEQLQSLSLPRVFAVLVNPRIESLTRKVFSVLDRKENAPMGDIPEGGSAQELCAWLRDQRNDLEEPAIRLHPEIGDVLKSLSHTDGRLCVRMSGSGATCFALFDEPGLAKLAAKDLSSNHLNWWVRDCCLN
ncbi:MAG: 4-(cytidine 5'-diphospho)-2-C-methyl-D-erythritol kinase [Boseongicola sp.]